LVAENKHVPIVIVILCLHRQVPSLLEFSSYVFSFHGLMCGPFCFYKDYVAFIDGSNYAPPPVDSVKVSLLVLVFGVVRPSKCTVVDLPWLTAYSVVHFACSSP